MTPAAYRLIAIGLALIGQVIGVLGLPVAVGSTHVGLPDAACGCCPADRTAGRCCCSRPEPPASACADDTPSCCARKKKPSSSGVTWVHPALRAKCLGPTDTVPESVVPASIPPAPPVAWTAPSDEMGLLGGLLVVLPSQPVSPDTPPPRSA